MAKDRTRHARIREPKQESQADMIARKIGQMSERISEDITIAIAGITGFADSVGAIGDICFRTSCDDFEYPKE